MTVAAPGTAPAAASETTLALPGRAYRGYALGLLMVIYVVNFVDRQVVSILAEPIKRDLGLADWQLGLMTGLAFAMLYTVLGLPIARIAERGDRPLIIAAAVAVWSGFTALSGMAQTFTHLILARIGVGVGEAGCTPPALSLIADTVPREQRASAVSVYMLGAPVGSILGLALGGLIADAFGWRMAFVVVGLPGLLLAVVAALTLREPRRRLARAAAAEPPPGIRDALRELAASRTYWRVVGGVTIKSFASYGALAFTGSFFFRNFPVELAEMAAGFGLKSAGFLGLALGVTSGLTAMIGTLLGGRLADHFARKDARAFAVIPAVGAIAGLPFSLAALNADSLLAAFAFLLAPGLLGSMWLGPAYGVVQSLVQPQTRATATAVMLFVANLIGLGLGPLFVGILSDVLVAQGLTDADAIRWSMMSFALLALPCAWLFWSARRSMREDIVS
ncbi:MAG: MFS transporter [Phenylobacterium zucineum]|nr:MAG: MFS transporter [Phenylobacterium zucineum]